MGKWTDLARQLVLTEVEGARAISAISAHSLSSGPNGPIGTNGTAPSLPPNIIAGLDRLRLGPGPLISNPGFWAVLTSSAHHLASSGWAAKALALGWTPLELFGASAKIGGDTYLEGLAVWLAGRDLLLLDERCAIVGDGPKRAVFNRFKPEGAVFLWELRDVQRKRMGVRHDA